MSTITAHDAVLEDMVRIKGKLADIPIKQQIAWCKMQLSHNAQGKTLSTDASTLALL
jgi:hypothetical protein